MKSLLLNLALAVLWMLLQRALSLRGFLTGFAIGFALLVLFRPVLGSSGYLRRVLGLFVFLAVFAREYFRAAAQTLRIALFVPRRSLQPRLLRYDVQGLSRLELLLLSHTVSLTPGTVTVEIASDHSHLLLHALDGSDPEAVRLSIDRTLRRAILRFTR